ncbi:MAG: hypothetical protein ABEH47_02375 [Haloferacaceae archaeon]
MVDVDSETLFNGAAAAVTTVAVVVFIINVEFGYSPVSKVGLVVALLAGVFAITQRTADEQLTLFGYGVIVVSVVALFFEVVSTFDAGDAAIVVGLLAIAASLFFLRRRLGGDDRFVSGEQATYAFGALAVLVAALLLVDVVTGGLTYELQPRSEIEVTGDRHDETRVASVVATNPTPLPERVEVPEYRACTAGNWSAYRLTRDDGERPPVQADLHVEDGYGQHVLGFSSRSFPARLHLEGGRFDGDRFRVERTQSCPDDESGTPYIAVYEATGERRDVRPV